jgi:co-chaperonin GroES (HSP10)
MSELILPKYLKDLIENETELKDESVEAPGDDAKARQLPKPKGWKLLCAVPPAEDTFDDSVLVKAAVSQRIEEQTTTVLFVVAIGPDAYKDTNKFPSGPWCEEGDFVLVRTYSGTRFTIHGREFRMINDDQVEGVVEDPRGYARA